MPRRGRNANEEPIIELDSRQLEDMFRERVCGLHLKNRFFEYATKSGEQFNCPVCLNDIKQPEAFCLLVCGHAPCCSCWLYMNEPKTCPVCRA